MSKKEFKLPFPYYVGIKSLDEIVNKKTRVCIMNILGGESSTVTPVSHRYSGGNVVAGVQYGRSGSKLETPAGDIPVYGSIKEVISAGHHFDTGVVYLPPTAVNHAVSELCSQNDDLKKIVIVTEKIAVRDARYIRWGCQQRGVDVFGANSLGIANAWDRVRVGGALGGDKPEESLVKGSVAIYSNSGNFCTTISEYIKTAGFGTSTILSSGKDIYIHFALPEFLYAAENDPRTKVAVVYIEPGGYYEKMALDWIKDGTIPFSKPIVAVVTGRWKKNLARAVGHAGAIAGGGDDAEAKEKWFDTYFGVSEFNEQKPTNVSEKGVRVSTIQDIPAAVASVMKKIGQKSDFEPIGDLSLKPWFVNDQKIEYSPKLIIKPVEAMSPYNIEIKEANKQVGGQFIRESMRNRSGVSYMDSKSQITYIHNHSLLHIVKYPFAATSIFAVTSQIPDETETKVLTPVINYFAAKGSKYINQAIEARKNGASPNAYLAASVLTSGNNEMYQLLTEYTSKLIDMFYLDIKGDLHIKDKLIAEKLKEKSIFSTSKITEEDERVSEYLNSIVKKYGLETIFTRYAAEYNLKNKADAKRANPVLLTIACILLSSAWKPLAEKQITRKNAEDLPTYLALNGVIVSCAALNSDKNSFYQELTALKKLDILETEFTSTCFQVLFNRVPEEKELFELNALLNLTITNGAGTISAKGSKESVSAGNYISTAYAGFMMNTGFVHGGNGYEAVDFLINELGDYDPYTQKQASWDKNLEGMADKVANAYNEYKKQEKAKGNNDYKKIPCTNHPVFKGKPVNIDPREDYVRGLFKEKSLVNPFLEFYHHLVVKLHEVGATKNVFCVNIDAVIATVSLGLFWKQFKKNEISEQEMQDIVFTLFLFARMVGCSAEIADHRNRGTNMDCRTPASEMTYAR
ncbi:MAG: CoA-binding protein [Spirochaetia bacterium]|nr:CoA-binding protein [Spirochaetia bacterium]